MHRNEDNSHERGVFQSVEVFEKERAEEEGSESGKDDGFKKHVGLSFFVELVYFPEIGFRDIFAVKQSLEFFVLHEIAHKLLKWIKNKILKD
jgi:hypothetical protein